MKRERIFSSNFCKQLSLRLVALLLVSFIPTFGIPGALSSARAIGPCPQTYCILENDFLRFSPGDNAGTRDRDVSSVDSSTAGSIAQPWYKSSVDSNWYPLTYSINSNLYHYPVDYAIGIGDETIISNYLFKQDLAGEGYFGDNLWTGSETVTSVVEAQDDYLGSFGSPSGSRQVVTSLTVDYSGFNVTAVRTGSVAGEDTAYGVGTIISTATLDIGGVAIEVRHTFTLQAGKKFLKVSSSIKNVSSDVIAKPYMWVGTRDNWVGLSDALLNERGNIVSGSFVAIGNSSEQAKAIRSTSGSEGSLFYSNNSSANTSIESCCEFRRAILKNPQSAQIAINNDNSYSISFKLAESLSPGATSPSVTWYFAGGALADFDEISEEVATDSGSSATPNTTYEQQCIPPTIDSLSPNFGSSQGNERVTVRGTGFGNSIYVNGVLAETRLTSNDKILFITPKGVKGLASVRIDGCGTSAKISFEYDPDPIVKLKNGNLVSTLGGNLNVDGSYLSSAVLTIGGKNITIISNTDERVVATFPPSVIGEEVIKLTTPYGSTTFKVKYVAPPILAASVPTGYIAQGDAVNISYAATGATSYSSSGILPQGLSFNTTTGALTGTATKEGAYSFSITATNAVGSDTKNYTLDIDRPTPKALTANLYFAFKTTSLSESNKSALDRLIAKVKAVAPRNLSATITMAGGAGNLKTDLTTTRHDQIKGYLEALGIKVKSATSTSGNANKVEVTIAWIR